MTHILKSVSLSLALMLAVAPAALGLSIQPAIAQSPSGKPADPAVTQVQDFYDALTASMKSGGTAKSRYDKLKPAIEKAFDLPAMTAIAVGPSWASLSEADKKALIDAFTRMTVASYAKNFDSYDGEKFPLDPVPVARGSDKYVKSKLVGTETHIFNYRMHQAGSEWKVIDILLEGNISQMAQKRSDFASTLSSGGPQALAKRINAVADQTLS
jgi:phospholipid transport system substrate-binding protein